jgi:hypothetical protein
MCGSYEGLVVVLWSRKRERYVGGLEGSLQNLDCMILSRNIVQALWPTRRISMRSRPGSLRTYYFSTQGCNLVFSFVGPFVDVPLMAAASLRALISKNPAITECCRGRYFMS